MKKTLSVGILILLLAACKKDPPIISTDTTGGVIVTKPEQPSEKQLVSTIVTEQFVTGSSVATQKFTDTYSYNNKNFVTAIHTVGSVSGVQDDVFLYDVNDNMIRETRTYNGLNYIYDITYVNNIPTLVTYTDPTNANYSYILKVKTGGNLVLGGTIFSMPPAEVEGSTTILNYDNLNMVSSKVFYATTPGSATTDNTAEYGSKKNPFIYSGSKWLLSGLPYANKNEPLKEITQLNANGVTTTTTSIYTYTYNDQGYPLTALKSTKKTQTSNQVTT